MRLGLGWVLGAALGLSAAQGCGSSEDNDQRACVPGASQSCAGPLDCDGYQVCNDEGSAFEPCMCGEGGSSGRGGTSDSGGSAGTSGGGGGTGDSGGSAGASDGGSSSGTSDAGGSGATSDGGAGGTTSGGETNTGGTGPATVTSATSSGGSGTSSGGSSGDGGTSTAGGGTGGSCSMEPTVMVLVDASSSMWDNQFWEPLREAVLGAVQELESEVSFGFATFTGRAGTCPLELNTVDIGLDSYEDIAEFYNAIEHPGVATEGPTAAALYTMSAALQSNLNDSRKAILLVTDGNPDFCDTGQTECRADVTVRVLQDAAAAGIPTLVAGLPDPGIDQDWLTAMANAGQGQPVSAPRSTEFCDGIPAGTAAILEGIEPDAWPSATYGDTMGPLEPIGLDDTQDVEGMTTLLVDAITDWASCAQPRKNRIESRY